MITDAALDFHFEGDVKTLFREVQTKILNGEKLTYYECKLYFQIVEYFDSVREGINNVPRICQQIIDERRIEK